MTYKNIKYSDDTRYELLWKQLQSNFQKPSISFSTNQEISHEQLGDIYREYASSDFNYIWDTYINSFNINEVSIAIDNLDDKKDAGYSTNFDEHP